MLGVPLFWWKPPIFLGGPIPLIPMIMGIRSTLNAPFMKDVDFSCFTLGGAGSLWYAPPELNPPVEVGIKSGAKDRYEKRPGLPTAGGHVEVQWLMKNGRSDIFNQSLCCVSGSRWDWEAKVATFCITYCVGVHKKVTSDKGPITNRNITNYSISTQLSSSLGVIESWNTPNLVSWTCHFSRVPGIPTKCLVGRFFGGFPHVFHRRFPGWKYNQPTNQPTAGRGAWSHGNGSIWRTY